MNVFFKNITLLFFCVCFSSVMGANNYSKITSKVISEFRNKEGEELKTLLQAHPEVVNAKDTEGKTLLFKATYACDLSRMQTLISHGANVNAANSNGFTPLYGALSSSDEKNRVKAAILLIENNASIEQYSGSEEGSYDVLDQALERLSKNKEKGPK